MIGFKRSILSVALAAVALTTSLSCGSAQTQSAIVVAKPISSFDLSDTSKTRFGGLEFVGGLAMRSNAWNFGALSGIRINSDGHFTAVADTGFWIVGVLQREGSGPPKGLSRVKIAPLLDAQGVKFQNKWQADVEGIAYDGSTVYVSTEQDTRIMRYDARTSLLDSPSVRVTEHFPEHVFGYNNGLESIAVLPKGHKFAGALLAIREKAEKGQPDNAPIPGFILAGYTYHPFLVESLDGFSITDADFLPNGDLLILERLSSMSRGIKVRMRRIAGEKIQPGSVLNGEVIFEAGRGQQVDNMEGLSVFKALDNSTRIGLVSDDNHWLLQRNLYLEFKLVE